jgi:hypothetical protein
MPTGTLMGYALMIIGNVADHTYVVSSHGQIWPCHGRSTGGTLICRGTGNTAEAACLSQTNGQAGIVYGITGVCHQTANRILLPSGQTVSRAHGYRGSCYMWGTYGLEITTGRCYSPPSNPWPELQTCRTTHTHP